MRALQLRITMAPIELEVCSHFFLSGSLGYTMSAFTSCSKAGKREELKEVMVGLVFLHIVGPSRVLVKSKGFLKWLYVQ